MIPSLSENILHKSEPVGYKFSKSYQHDFISERSESGFYKRFEYNTMLIIQFTVRCSIRISEKSTFSCSHFCSLVVLESSRTCIIAFIISKMIPKSPDHMILNHFELYVLFRSYQNSMFWLRTTEWNKFLMALIALRCRWFWLICFILSKILLPGPELMFECIISYSPDTTWN